MITGCLCGSCRFEYRGAVGPANYCHCTDCRRVTRSAFNVGVKLAMADFSMTRGAPKTFIKQGASGRELSRHFCGDCGSPLFTSSPAHADLIFVKAGALDDPAVITPSHESWTCSEVTWARPAAGLTRYEKSRIA